ncbi:MAG TPA: hypothetical protein ENJ20_04590 [Bacteroidetes bacterium]|nr:hypothetical protein [Bacteroidota bacterium]
MKVFYTILFWSAFHFTAISQEVVFLTNPSFEGNAQFAAIPGGWQNCAFNNESPPDIHPVLNATVGMSVLPLHGETFLGLLTKKNSTVESIGQKLSQPLRKGVCYSFSVALCKSDKYYIIQPETKVVIHYDNPLVLRLWGGASPCGKKSLLAVSPPIENTDWMRYTFQFSPEVDLDWISFDVFFTSNTTTPYRGNLMMDDASPFIPINCQTRSPLVNLSSLPAPEYKFIRHRAPKYKALEWHWAVGDLLIEYLNCRIVENERELNNLVFDNCNKLGFKFSSHELIDRRGYAIKEIAVNILKFKTHRLVVGIPALGEKLNKRRIRRIKRTFREIGLTPKWYRIVLLPSNADHSKWLCGQREIWLKVEKRNK